MEQAIEKRLEVLEDIEAIRRLKYRYCYLADAGIAGDMASMDELLSHFTDDAWVDFSEFGIHKGKAAVTSFYKDVVAVTLSYSAHMVSNPIINVSGKTAVGNWYVFVPCTLRETNAPAWLQGKYEEEYVKLSGSWKWQAMIARFDFITPYEEGWVKARMLES